MSVILVTSSSWVHHIKIAGLWVVQVLQFLWVYRYDDNGIKGGVVSALGPISDTQDCYTASFPKEMSQKVLT